MGTIVGPIGRGFNWGRGIIWHWNSGQTAADRAKLCIEIYWEVVGGAFDSRNARPLLTPNVLPRGAHNFLVEMTAKWWQMEYHFEFIGAVKSRVPALSIVCCIFRRANKVLSGFALYLLAKQFVRDIGDLSPTIWVGRTGQQCIDC